MSAGIVELASVIRVVPKQAIRKFFVTLLLIEYGFYIVDPDQLASPEAS